MGASLSYWTTQCQVPVSPGRGNREPQWTHRQSPGLEAVARSDAMQALQGEAGTDELEETTGLIEAKFPLGLEEDVARRSVPGPHELFPCHFLVATLVEGCLCFLRTGRNVALVFCEATPDMPVIYTCWLLGSSLNISLLVSGLFTGVMEDTLWGP